MHTNLCKNCFLEITADDGVVLHVSEAKVNFQPIGV